MPNEKLLEVMGGDVTPEQAFSHVNDVLKNAVGGCPRKVSDITATGVTWRVTTAPARF